MTLGRALARLRHERSLSLGTVAAATGLTEAELALLEADRAEADPATLGRIIEAFCASERDLALVVAGAGLRDAFANAEQPTVH